MRGANRAIAYELWTGHRWGVSALGAYLMVLAAVKLFVVVSGRHVILASPESFAFADVVPITATFLYLLAVFTYGLSGDLGARQSIFPSRLFTLPAPTEALARWPMVYGAGAVVLLWVATRLVAMWPARMTVPVVWPALFGIALLAWAQALTWLPYPLPGLRVAATLLWLTAGDTIVLLALHLHASEIVMCVILAPQPVLAYGVARYAIGRARRGDVPDWAPALRIGGTARSNALRPFRTASSAQLWLEWKQHGRLLPTLVAILLPVELLLLWTATNAAPLVFEILLGAALTPVVMAPFTAAGARRGLSPFVATRPLGDAALVAAKLQAAAWSTAAAWLLVLVATPIALIWSHTYALVATEWRDLARIVGSARAAAFTALLVAMFVSWTWRQLVQSLLVGLTGRDWLVKGSMLAMLLLLALCGPLMVWIANDVQVQAWLWHALLWIPAALVGLKLALSSWVATRVTLTDRSAVLGAAGWLAAVLALYALLSWMFGTPFIPRYQLMLIAVLMVPLARLAASPMSIAWNRHR